MNWYLGVLKNYAGFDGRARRKEYWMFALFNALITVVLEVLYAATKSNVLMILLFVYILAVFVPGLAVGVRRLHDLNKSGAWLLIAFVPFIGGIWLFVLTCLAGTRGSNQYGPDPKLAAA